MRQIRKSVFETNSSSTHSMTLFKSTEENGMTPNYIIQEVYLDFLKNSKFFQDNFKDRTLDENTYLDEENSTLHLYGFNIPDGDESDVVICLVISPMAKIQYYFMAFRNLYAWQSKKRYICDWFSDYAQDYYKVDKVEFKHKNWDGDEGGCVYLDSRIEPPLTDEIFENRRDFYAYMDEVMKKDNVVVYTDKPYHMWGRTESIFMVV